MSVLVTIFLLEGVYWILLNNIKMREMEIIKKWQRGELSYDELLALKRHNMISVHKLDGKVVLGEEPEASKKKD